MSENILKIKYYKNGQFKGSEGVSIFQSSNLQSTLKFKFDEDLGDASVVANILIPYPEGSQLYGQHQKQSLFMKKQVDSEGGYIYSSAILRGYLATNGKAYVNAQVFASDGYIDSTNTGNGIVVNGIPYIIGYTTETIGGVSVDLLNLFDPNSNKVYVQNQAGIIVLQNNLICLIKEFVASVDGDGNFNGTLRLTSGVEVKNYQQVEFKITASAPYYVDYPMTIEESYVLRQALASAQSDIINAQADILLKQDKVDPDINEDGVDHSVVGNINDLIDRANEDEGDIGTLQGQMATAQQDIADLQRIVGYGINIVGTMTTQDALPSDQDVSDYVIAQTGEAPTRGLAVIVKVDYTSGTDTIYFYVFDGTNWHHFEMQFLNDAENGVKGLIQGNYNAADTTPGKLMVSIVSGEVAEIYYNDANGVRHSLTSVLADVVAKVINGTSAVEMAKKDGIGRNIATTYQTKQEGASKTYVQDYASPKALYDIGYSNYINHTYEPKVASGYNYNVSNSVSSIGYSVLSDLDKVLDSDILLGNQNGVTNKIWLALNNTESVKIRITTEMYVDGQLVYTQATESASRLLAAGHAELFTIETIFDTINDPILLPRGSTIRQSIELWREEGTTINWLLLSTSTYSAYMTLNKIGFVRYSLEAEPDAIVSGHDSAPTIDSNGDLVITSTDGEINYVNGNSAPLSTKLKLPMDNGLADPSSVLPARAGQVKTALEGKLEKVDTTASYLRAYTINGDGTQTTTKVTRDVEGNVIPIRDANGYLYTQNIVEGITPLGIECANVNYVNKQKVRAEVDTFHQLVPNDKQQAIMASGTSTVLFNYSSNTGDKLFVKIAYKLNGGDFVLNCKYNDDSTETIITGANQASPYATIFTATKPIVSFYYYSNIANQEYSDFNIINLTADYGAGQEPSLEECQKIYRVPYGYGENKISVLEDSKKITSFQTPIQAKVVNFNQLVLDKYASGATLSADHNFIANTPFYSGHAYYVKIDVPSNNSVYYEARFRNYSDGSISQNLFGSNRTTPYEGIKVCDSNNYSVLTIYAYASMSLISAKCIDLTQMEIDYLSLPNCKSLFNAKSYAYTLGTDMQLIYDGEKPIALVEIPEQEPILLWENPNPDSTFTAQQININISQYKYIIFAYKVTDSASDTQEYRRLKVKSSMFFIRTSFADGNGDIYSRTCRAYSSYISVEGGIKYSGGSSTNNDTFIIPTAIYGTNTL